MQRTIAISIALLLAGCQSMPTMTADQLKAVPDGGAICSSATGIWGQVKFVYIKAERGIIPNGGIDATADCTLSMRNVTLPRLPPLPTIDPTPGAPPKP